MSQLTRIVAIVLNTRLMTVYKEDGTSVVYAQGDPRIRRLIDTATPLLTANGYADVDLSEGGEQQYADFEKKSGGLVRFFRVAKQKIADFFTAGEVGEPMKPTIMGNVPIPVPAKTPEALKEALDDLMAHAIPATSPEFNEAGLDIQQNIVEADGHTPKSHSSSEAEDTIMAMVGDTVVPGVELIKSQFTRAVKLGSTEGVKRFLERIGTVINERKHSIDDLLKFMERGDMPIADDGTIIIFKVLRKHPEDGYVDCHTRKVAQYIGTKVQMDPALVDHDRANECSNGLHVARRGYISSFSGDVCVMAKLAPEDVIAVPRYDANKMRVCAYHIIMELTPAQYSLLNQNKPITDDRKGKIMLAKAIAGQHVGTLRTTTIRGQQGTDLVYSHRSPTGPDVNIAIKNMSVAEPAKELAPVEALENPEKEYRAPVLDPKRIAQEVTKAMNSNPTYRDQIRELLPNIKDAETLAKILALKKASKKSWAVLGLTPKEIKAIEQSITESK